MTNVVPMKTGGAIAGIVPTSLEDVFRLAKAVAASGLAPQGMKTPEQLTVAILHGLEIGLPPMQAIQRIAVVNGRPTVWGDAVPAILLSKGFRIREWDEGEGDAATAWCEITRPDGDKIVRSFSVADSKVAGLFGKAGPWQLYKKRMRQMRARGFAARDGAADALAGLYLREEIEDEAPMRDITPKQVALELPDIPEPELEEAADETAQCRNDIKNAISVEMLEHLREIYPDADYEVLAPEYDAKLAELSAKGA